GLLQRLSVFVGGWTLVAAVGASDGVDEFEVIYLMEQLVDKSLVVVDQGDEKRYRLLETIREYGRERLRQSGDEAAVRGRHRDYYLGLAEEAEPYLTGAAQVTWLRQLEQEHGNLRAALEWSVAGREAEPALRLVGALWRFWHVGGYFREAYAR